MSGEYQDWDQKPRRRGRNRHERDAEYERSRRSRSGSHGQDSDPTYPGSGGYQDPGGYEGAADYDAGGYGPPNSHDSWPGQQDPYGRTDPRGGRDEYYGQPDPYGGQGDYNGGSGYAGHQSYGDDQDYGGYPDNQPGYDDGYGGRDHYDDRHSWPSQPGYASQRYEGQDPYAESGHYDPQGYPADPGYQHGQPGYDQGDPYGDYDAYGRPAASGPLPPQAGSGAYGPDDWASDAGGSRGGARRSPRGMDADDARHNGFFSGFGHDDDDHYSRKKRKRGRGISAGTVALLIVIALLAGGGYGAWKIYSVYKGRHAAYSGNGYGSVVITVAQGEGADSIAEQLLSKGVIAAIDPWASYVSTKPNTLQPGEYKLHKHMGVAQAWAMLTNPKDRQTVTVTIVDGVRWKKMLPILAKESGIPLSQFESAITDTKALGLPSYAKGNPEGYLYPATYDIQPGETALKILQTAVHQFNMVAAQINLAAGASKANFTEAQVITEASLLEAEVGPKYYKQVARVLDNRLQSGTPLELDSTIAYITGDYSYNLSNSQLHTPSPYNTFLHTDLPPGPIDSPDAAAINAVLHPSPPSEPWTYFVTVNKAGLTLFTTSQAQFTSWSQEAARNGV